MKTTAFRVIYLGKGGVPNVVAKPGKRYQFKDGNNLVHNIRIRMMEDVDDARKNVMMTITLLRDRADALASGYVTGIVDDLSNIAAPADQAK